MAITDNIEKKIEKARRAGYSDDQIRTHLSNNGVDANQFLSHNTFGDRVDNAFSAGIDKRTSGISTASDAILERNPIKFGEGLLEGAAGTIEAAVSPLTAAFQPVVEPVLSPVLDFGKRNVIDPITDLEQVQSFAMSPAGDTLDRIARSGENAGIISDTFLAGRGASALRNTGQAVAQDVSGARSFGDALAGAIPEKTSNTFTNLRGRFDERVQKSMRSDIDELLGSTKALSNQRELAASKGVDLNDFLSDPAVYRGIKVSKNKIDPTEAIAVVDGRIDALVDAKRSLLPEIDRFVPSIPKDVLREAAYKHVDDQRLTPADTARQKARVDVQLSALPDEMKPSQIDDLRARFRSSSRDAKDIQKPNSHFSALENAARDTVFNITDDLPVSNAEQFRAINDYIRQSITVKDVLDKNLRGQTVKGGRIKNYVGRTVGAVAGSGGGVFGVVIGAELGGLITDIITNNQLGSNVKMVLIREITDEPEIIRQAEELLGALESQTVPLLDAPTSEFRTQIKSSQPINIGRKSQSDVDASEATNPNVRR